jgi:hypothetical protein
MNGDMIMLFEYFKIYLLFLVILFRQNSICAFDGISFFHQEIITTPRRFDGFGAQFQTLIYTVIYAELTNKKFVYTPFKDMEHNYNKDPHFIEKKERLINFKDNFEINNCQASAQQVGEMIRFFEVNITKCINSLALKKIKNIFRANKNIINHFNNNNFNIAIHIRRHNQHDSRIEGTNISDSLYLEIINKLRKIYSEKNPFFHLYSQGNVENFKSFISSDVFLHLNESIEDVFISMVLADILVTSASSFSYTAGILSEGIIYYIPFWHSPLPNWININNL